MGAFFARDVELRPGVAIAHRSFGLPPSTCIGAADGSACDTGGTCQAGACVTASCSDAADGTQTFVASADFGVGPVTFTATSTSTTPTTTPTTTLTITRAGQLLETEQVGSTGPSGLTQVSVDYGPGVHGVQHVLATTDGTLVTETIDGRVLEPLAGGSAQTLIQNPPTLTFVDGKPAPVVTVDDGVFEAIAAITSRAGAGASQCGVPQTALRLVTPPTLRPLTLSTPAGSEPGHKDNPEGFSRCGACESYCKTAETACVYAGGVACGGVGSALVAIPFLAIGAAVLCEITADAICVATDNSCASGCHNIGSQCCPQACGHGCCDFSETCLDTGQSLCCNAGYTPCPGPKESCVDLTQDTCLPSGEGCGFGVPVCGSGPEATCCAFGTCNGNLCVLGPIFQVTAAATETQTDVTTCLSGTGFTPGATVSFTYSGIPGIPGVFSSGDTAIVDGFGNVRLGNDIEGTLVVCTQEEAFGKVTLTAVDGDLSTIGTGQTTSSTLPASAWCVNYASGGTINGGCN